MGKDRIAKLEEERAGISWITFMNKAMALVCFLPMEAPSVPIIKLFPCRGEPSGAQQVKVHRLVENLWEDLASSS